jgi:hypothetical protein
MKKIITGLFCTIALLSPSIQGLHAATVSSSSEVARIQAMIVELTTLINSLKTSQSEARVTSAKSKTKPNLEVVEVSIGQEELSGNSIGNSLPSQTLTLTIRNTESAYVNINDQKFTYEAIVYEDRSIGDKKTSIKGAGETAIPDGGQSITVSLIVEGGLPFNNDFERSYYPSVRLDTNNKIKETNERDNWMKATGTVWTMDYYKG